MGQLMGLQSIGHDFAIEQQQNGLSLGAPGWPQDGWLVAKEPNQVIKGLEPSASPYWRLN